MENKESSTPNIDWRYRTATTLEKDWLSPFTGIIHKKGAPVIRSTIVKHEELEITIGDPSAPVLFLNQSHTTFMKAMENHPFIGEWPPKTGNPSAVTYDYFEFIMASIVFSHTALEAFANEEIPEDFVYEMQTENGILIPQSKDWIERNISLDEKFATILPKITGKPSPKGLKIWENYVHLRRLRHRIIHMKSKDRAVSKNNNLYPDSIWSKLLDPNQSNYPAIAKEMILHFRGKDSYHWLKFCPF